QRCREGELTPEKNRVQALVTQGISLLNQLTYGRIPVYLKTLFLLFSLSLSPNPPAPPDHPLPSGVRLVPVSQTSLGLSWDPVIGPGSPKEDWTFQVECVPSSDPGNVKIYQLLSNLTGIQLTELKPRHKYECRVRMMTVSVGQHTQPVSAWTLSNGKTWEGSSWGTL
uniref:Fibronectin type-III domain-containing protein n=1 Tax=Hucho hucho TaxID=62062 RepID=A0A4W5JF83_9TELE